MAQTRPQLVAPRAAQTLEAVRAVTGSTGFDPDVWHVMEERDTQLIEQEILHGAGSAKFVYSFPIRGQKEPVSGISVIGARHLASHYGKLKHRLVASFQKTGTLLVVTSYPAPGIPMSMSASTLLELGDEPDFYEAVCEVEDINTGNAIQMQRRELRFELAERGTAQERQYERLHYATIAQSKAYRNAVLALIPQTVQIRWKAEMLKLDRNTDIITDSVIDVKRANVLRFAAQRAIPLDRRAVEELTMEQIEGLGNAAREGQLPAFVQAAQALGLDVGTGEVVENPAQQRPERPAAAQTQQQRPAEDRGAAQQSGQDPDTAGGPGVESPQSTQGDERQQGDPARASSTGAKREAGKLFPE